MEGIRKQSQLSLNELCMIDEGEECVYDQSCYYGFRCGDHGVYCHNDVWEEAPFKCRRTWFFGGEVQDEDCPGFKLNISKEEI